MKKQMILLAVLFSFIFIVNSINVFKIQKNSMSLQQIASKLTSSVRSISYDLHTSQGNHMDCLKIEQPLPETVQNFPQFIGVFHQFNNGYETLYYAQMTNNTWKTITSLSERGSQGTIFIINAPDIKSYFISYQLQNHQHGNTIAIRYYDSIASLRKNFFTYQYQLQQLIDSKIVRNIGTPSIELITQALQTNQIQVPVLKNYHMNIKFHFSPDGAHDLPGFGTVQIKPYNDFMKNGIWIGGCKQNYQNWKGNTDSKVQSAIKLAGGLGKIGQRDYFYLNEVKYYLYQSNIDPNFNWSKWRIFLYQQSQNKAVMIPFNFDKVIDLANPHITSIKKSGKNKNKQQLLLKNQYALTFFVPSQAMVPGTTAKPGQMYCQTAIDL